MDFKNKITYLCWQIVSKFKNNIEINNKMIQRDKNMYTKICGSVGNNSKIKFWYGTERVI